jgi:hypothetical protein
MSLRVRHFARRSTQSSHCKDRHSGSDLRGNQLDTHSKNNFRIWYAPKVGSLRIVYGVGSQRKKPTKERCRTRSLMTWLVTYPHRIRTLRELIVPLSSGPEPELMSRSQHLSAQAITSRTGSALLARLSITPRNSTSSNWTRSSCRQLQTSADWFLTDSKLIFSHERRISASCF